jgi:hypothetical protein
MLKMFDFSEMEDMPLKDDLQNAGSHLPRANLVAKNPTALEAQETAIEILSQ